MPLGPVIFVVVVALDLVTKMLALRGIEPGTSIEILPFFNLVLVWNTGISFGLLQGDRGPWLLIGLALAISAVLVVWLWREERLRPRLALWLILAGAVGNVVDRLRYGAVVDFLDFHLAGYHWPAFNVSDSAIFVGAAVLLIDGLVYSKADLDKGAGRV